MSLDVTDNVTFVPDVADTMFTRMSNTLILNGWTCSPVLYCQRVVE